MPLPLHPEPPEVIARGDGVLGEVVLRRRPGPVHELIVNGVFLMDTADTSTERLLAGTVLARHPAPHRILVGGLGLACTLAALLADSRPRWIDVVEIEPLLVRWLRTGWVPPAQSALADSRVTLRIGDVRDVLRDSVAETYHAVVLDVDNGPGFLVHDRNAEVYQAPALSDAARALRPDGLLVVWSGATAPVLEAALATHVGPTERLHRRVTRDGRDLDYYLYTATRRPE